MVNRLLVAAALACALCACAVSGETCGLGRCENDSQCVTLFTGGYTSKAATPGTDIDHNYWCLGTCPGGMSCSGQCLQDPADDTVVACAGTSISMSISCPTVLGATLNGTCTSFNVVSCAANVGSPCAAGKVCSLGTVTSGESVGPLIMSVTGASQSTVQIDLSSLSHTTLANPPLSQDLPTGITPQINVPSTCSN